MISDFDGITGAFDNQEGSPTNMAMLYGLSDFWHVMFEDSDKIDLLLRANAISASDVYSKFLQLTSDITLEDVQTTLGSQMTLLIVDETSKVLGTEATFKIGNIAGCRMILNRPFLPTLTYEEGVHYFIDESEGTISFHQNPFGDKFPTRLSQSGDKQIALWMVDAVADEQVMGRTFAPLVGVTPENSTEKFRDFLYGLFFLYTHGPDLSSVRKGLNVVLGVPLARDDETVLSVRKNPGEEQYYVITDSNSYLLPYGLYPDVEEGTSLKVGEEVTSWVEVQDYLSDGDWWINLEIPQDIIPYTPEGEIDSYAKPGSFTDYLMRTYLKDNTFLVRVNVSSFKNIESFKEIGEIIKGIKPVHTTPVYIWSVPVGSETFRLLEDIPATRLDDHRCDYVVASIKRMRRNNSGNPMDRCCSLMTRMTLAYPEYELLGLDPVTSGTPQPLLGGTATGYANRVSQFRSNTPYEKAVIKAVLSRDNWTFGHLRSLVNFSRGVEVSGHTSVRFNPFSSYIDQGMRVVPLHLTSEMDLVSRMSSLDVSIPLQKPVFTLFKPRYIDGPINSLMINSKDVLTQYSKMIANFSTVFSKTKGHNYMGEGYPHFSPVEYIPQVSAVKERDYLLCTRVYDRIVAVYWITSNPSLSATSTPMVQLMPDSDEMVISDDAQPLTRGLGLVTGIPFYTTRGGTFSVEGEPPKGGVNQVAVNMNQEGSYLPERKYSDTLNSELSINRNGAKLAVRKILDSDWS